MGKNPIHINHYEVILTSADIQKCLDYMAQQNIKISDIIYVDPLTIRFHMVARDYARLSEICNRQGGSVTIQRHYGVLPLTLSILRRPILVVGLLSLILLSGLLPTRVLLVRVSGNSIVSSREILQHASACGIQFGVSCRSIRNDQVKNALLSSIPQLQWVGINTHGCVAVISVREGQGSAESTKDVSIGSIVASRDAIIRQITVQQGNLLCTIGQAVKQGQVLVSPYTDCGICIRFTDAQGEIYGDTERQLTVIFLTQYDQRCRVTRRWKNFSLIIGKKRINFIKGSGISSTTCAKIYEEKYITLPGGFPLPIGMICETFLEYETSAISISPVSAQLEALTQDYLLYSMDGGQILSTDFVQTNTPAYTRMDGYFRCYELIGIKHPEEENTEHE